MKSKYVIICHQGVEIPIVFSQLLLHKQVAGKNQVQAAGFCELDIAGRWITGGASDSLWLSSRPQDAEILNRHL